MKRHTFDPTSFVFGLLFCVVAIAALAGGVDVDALRLQWMFPLALIVTGIVVIGSSATSSRATAHVVADGSSQWPPADDASNGAADGTDVGPVDPDVTADDL